MKKILLLLFCLCMVVACGNNNNALYSGISNSGSYRLRSASAFSSYSGGVLLNYTGMTGTLTLANDSWKKSISYRGYSTTTSGKFSSAYLNGNVGNFTMLSSGNAILYTGTYRLGALNDLVLQYDTYLDKNAYLTLTETWIKN